MVIEGKTRCILITHPSFNEKGVKGIKEAQHFGNQMMKIINGDELFKHVPESQHAELKEHLKRFKVLIRKLDSNVVASKR